jgi:dCTP deaminase
MISPFLPYKDKINGMSAGLSAASYDLRIAEDRSVGPTNPGLWMRLKAWLRGEEIPPAFQLASTLECFDIPNDVCAFVCDKSSYARLGLSVYNTLFDPGFRGYGTLELANQSQKTIHIKAGDPICQMVFYHLDEPTDRPYKGKYQNQKAGPQPAVLDTDDAYDQGIGINLREGD